MNPPPPNHGRRASGSYPGRAAVAAAARSLTVALARPLLCALALALVLSADTGCMNKQERKPMPPRYDDKGPKPNVPAYLQGSIYELTDVENDDVHRVASFGLVGRLRGTGDTTAPGPVRTWMVGEMMKHGWGSRHIGYEKYQPEDILGDPAYAIVRVDALIPPGARKDQFIDVQVSCLPGNNTTSLSRGVLFQTEMRELRTNAPELRGPQVLAKAWGPIVVNPAFALEGIPDASGQVPATGQARASLRRGLVMDNGRVMQDRPLILRLRTPQLSLAREIERRINTRFQAQIDRFKGLGNYFNAPAQANAYDEGLVEVYVPKTFKGDWQHFIGVVNHLFLNGSPEFSAVKAKELADIVLAQGSDAPLLNISYCWEALGTAALPAIQPLMASENPDVAFAAARAGAFIGDSSGSAQRVLVDIASTKDHPHQIAAIEVMGSLPPSLALKRELRRLLDSDQTLARIEAYKVLANTEGGSYVATTVVKRAEEDERFVLDLVPCDGPTIVYASTRGMPRIAVIGQMPYFKTPGVFRAMGDRFMVASNARGRNVTIFFRDERSGREPIKMLSRPDLEEILMRLGGEAAPGERKLDFTYGEVLALLQTMAADDRLLAPAPRRRNRTSPGAPSPVAFVLQESTEVEDIIRSAPSIDAPSAPADGARPLTDEPEARNAEPQTPAAPRMAARTGS